MSKRIDVTFTMALPDIDASDIEISEWLAFELHANGEMSMSNPLSDREIEAEPWPRWRWA